MSSIPFFLVFFAGAVLLGVWRGGGPERVVATAYILALAGSAYVGFLRLPGDFRTVPIGLFCVDALLLAGLTVIAIRANRWWVIVAAGCQLVTVLSHAAKLIDPKLIPNGYAFLVTIWSWPMVACLAFGTFAHSKRRAEGRVVPDWKPSWSASEFTSRAKRRES